MQTNTERSFNSTDSISAKSIEVGTPRIQNETYSNVDIILDEELTSLLTKKLRNLPPTKRKNYLFHLVKAILNETNANVFSLQTELQTMMQNNEITKWKFRDKSKDTEYFLRTQWGRFIDAGLITIATIREYDSGFYSHLSNSEKDLFEKIPNISNINDNTINELSILGYSPKEIVRLAAAAQKKY